MSDNEQQKKAASASGFAGGISFSNGDDDVGEETTRRIGGGFGISFGPGPAGAGSGIAFAQPSLMSHSHIDTTQQKAQVQSINVSMPPVTKPGCWKLSEVPTLPEFHPLERTAVFVPHSKASEVSARISDVLRDRSIEAKFDDEKAKVKCVTPDGVDFRVRLYRGRNTFSHGIIVEVQRRFGSSVNFYRETMAILDAAEGKAVPPPPPSMFGSSAGNSLPMVSDSEDDSYTPSGSSSLQMVAKMFEHSGYDSHYLAYQTLLPLTDASKMGLATARSVSTELLKSNNAVGRKILSLVLAKNDEDDMFKLRTMAMTVLANAIQSTKGAMEMSLREELRPTLIQELYKSESNPRSAQMAAQCVEYMIQDDHYASEFYDALEKAVEVGSARHAGLQRQAKRCLDKIQKMQQV